ncbi:M56 family metallopeptidase [Dokdonia ponticola]|uniref:M56 family metallopeptidase n=1 Tax=Dokdonia ponticola TaxID=2041041 RepID=A0ABV9I1P1_9FLAO
MESFIYIIKSIVILSIFYSIYCMVLQKDTFFSANRHYLLSGIVAAFVFPFIEYTKTTYRDIPAIAPSIIEESTFTDAIATISEVQQEAILINWWQIALIIYGIGFTIMITRLLIQLISLYKLISAYPKTRKGGYTYVAITDKAITPFSFFTTICYNPSLHTPKELEMILAHEKIHVRQRHTIDILLTQCMLAIQWFNPLAWLYKKSLEQNLEYIADNGAIKEVSSSREYQHTLVKVSSTLIQPALTNNFYHSLIKKRIVMLNKQTSRKRNLWKLGLVLPALALFMYSFNIKEVVEYREISMDTETALNTGEVGAESAFAKAETKTETDSKNTTNKETEKAASTIQKQFLITKESTDEELKQIETYFKETFKSTQVRFTKVNHINNKLVSFDFQTKMADDVRFFTRFSVNNSGNLSPFSLIAVDEHEILKADGDGSEVKFTPEQSLTSFKIRQESMGSSPILVVNGVAIDTEKQDIVYETDAGIRVMKPTKAMALYGGKAKDGAIVIEDPNYTTKINGKYIKTPKNNTTNPNQGIAKEISPTQFRIRITKNTTDKELEKIKKELEEQHGFDFNYSVERNDQNEIIALKINYKTAKNNNGNYSVSSDSPIADVYIFEDENGSTGIGNSGSVEEIRKKMEERKAQMQERMTEMKEVQKERQAQMKERMSEMKEVQKERQEELESLREIEIERREEVEKRLEKRQEELEERKEIQEKKLQERREQLEEKRAILEERKAEMLQKRSEMRQQAIVEGRNNARDKKLFITSSPNGVITNVNRGGVITSFITKTTTDTELKKIQTSYENDGIKFSYKSVKRNSRGEITGVVLKLSNKDGNKTAATFKSTTEAIPTIYVGYTKNQ